MANLAILGATGNVGRRLVDEALARGHTVTAVARSVDAVAARPGLTALAGDISDPATADALKGHDVLVSSARFGGVEAATVIDAARRAGIPRLVVVGGAASLSLPDGSRLFDSPDFPEAYRVEAGGGIRFLEALKREQALDWTFVSPSAEFGPGERDGRFRLGLDDLLFDADGRSHVSYENFAIALLDEIERPAHSRRRFTVGS